MEHFNRRAAIRSGVTSLAIGVCGSAAIANQQREASVSGLARLGINIAPLADWESEFPFVDIFSLSREWISQLEGAGWAKGDKLSLDASGWVKNLPPQQYAETPMASFDGWQYEGGTYRVLYEGRGELAFWAAARVVEQGLGQMVIDVTSGKGPIWLRLKRTDPSDPIRNIRILRPGFTSAVSPGALHPDFLKRHEGMACIRFMDWMSTNHSRQVVWEDRPKLSDARFTVKGAPLETMIDMCNRLGADPWFCMPHLADDGYVRQFAEMVKQKLSPELKIYVEYSNEVWNDQFGQAKFAQTQARISGIPRPAWIATKSINMFSIWEKVFGSSKRLVRVFPSQAANSWLSQEILKYKDSYKFGDVLAIAPYISMNVPMQGDGLTAAEVGRWSLDRLLDHIEQKALPECIGWMRAQKAIADKFNLKLVAYEGGQHLVGILNGENEEALTKLFHAANAHPRMGSVYERYFEAWAQIGGDLHCHFMSMQPWSKWGSWGLLRHGLEDPKKSPKFMATMRWAKKQGQAVRLPG
jgi:hypothetical protein